MRKTLSIAFLTAFAAGCGESGGSDTDTDTDTGTDTVTIADGTVVVGNVTSASFDSTAGTLTVQVPLDGSDVLQEYVADGTRDGYSRFTLQDDLLDREYTAFAAESTDGSLVGVVVIDGGQFNRFFGGGSITQNSYTAPTTGLVSYAGAYVGVTNVGDGLATGGADASLTPEAATEISGLVFLNADFTDNAVNGAIYDRVFDPDGVAYDLPTIVMTAADIEDDGLFTGAVEFGDLTSVGTYTGAFGGDDAASVAGIISLTEGFLEGAEDGGVAVTDFEGISGEAEYGVFVLDQCTVGVDCITN